MNNNKILKKDYERKEIKIMIINYNDCRCFVGKIGLEKCRNCIIFDLKKKNLELQNELLKNKLEKVKENETEYRKI